jgi:glycosyltransferase involved in cell wall biosynthesis
MNPKQENVSARSNPAESTKDINVLMIGEALYRQGGIVTFQTLLIDVLPSNVLVRHLGTVGLGGAFNKLYVFVTCCLKLLFMLVTSKVDVAHLHVSLGASFYRQCIVAIICFVFRKPVIMHVHAGEFPTFYNKVGPISRWLCRFVFKRSTKLVMLTDSWREFYENEIGVEPSRLVTKANPVELPSVENFEREKSDLCQFVYLGKMDHDKGTFDLLKAIEKISTETRNASMRFVIAGNGMVEEVRKQVDQLELSACVEVRDWIDPEERDQLLSESDVFVLPSYFEGMPMSLLEAMSWSMPVITTPVGGIPDFVVENENGLFHEPGDCTGLSVAIQRLVNSADDRKRLGATGRLRVEAHCPKLYASQMTGTYSECLQS